MPQVFIPPSLRRTTDGQKRLQISATTIRQVIDGVDEQFPGFRERVCASGSLKPGISVAIGSRISDLGLLEPVQESDEVHFVVSVSGG